MKEEVTQPATLQLEFRAGRASDAEALAMLTDQLGYEASVAEIRARLDEFAQDPNHEVLVACLPDGTVVGWIDVAVVYHLQTGRSAEIGGLVVADSQRSRGVGRRLLAHAEAWARAKGMKNIRVRSNVKRTDAHRFYERENYIRSKTSAVFDKRL